MKRKHLLIPAGIPFFLATLSFSLATLVGEDEKGFFIVWGFSLMATTLYILVQKDTE